MLQAMEHVVMAKIQKETIRRMSLVPVLELLVANLKAYHLGVIPKNVMGNYQLIPHHSYPLGASVKNDHYIDDFWFISLLGFRELARDLSVPFA